jgi:hypothetical protein
MRYAAAASGKEFQKVILSFGVRRFDCSRAVTDID